MLDINAFPGRVTCITGPEKNCGKTQFMNFLIQKLAAQGHVPAVMTAGYDGEARDLLSGSKKPSIYINPGTIVVTPERFLRTSTIFPEILEVVPGATSLGNCCIARAQRAGTVILASGEGNTSISWTLKFLEENRLAATVLIDGAFNRITQASAWNNSQLVYVVRVDTVNVKKTLETLTRLLMLSSLEEAPQEWYHNTSITAPEKSSSAYAQTDTVYSMPDVLSLETVHTIPERAKTVILKDFTRVFLPFRELKSLMTEKRLAVLRKIPCAGIPVIVRGLSFKEFYDAVPELPLKELLFPNPYQDS